MVILSPSTSTQIPNHKTSEKKKKHISKQHSKQAIRQGKLRKIKNSINNKNSNHCVNNDFANTFRAAEIRSLTLAGSPEF